MKIKQRQNQYVLDTTIRKQA